MLSTVPAFSCSEPGLPNPVSGYQTGFTPWDWDCSDLFSVIKSYLKPSEPDLCSDDSGTGSVRKDSGFHNMKTGSDESSAGSIKMNSISEAANVYHGVPSSQTDEQISEETKNSITGPNSGSTDRNYNWTELNGSVTNSTVLQEVDERKRKRMESNRESARRSRKRKQNHMENLNNQVNRLGLENREIANRIRVVLYHIQRLSTDNDRLGMEQEILRRRLSEMRRILIFRQIQQQWARNCNTMIVTKQNPSSIIDQII